jgi:hypothetical protein
MNLLEMDPVDFAEPIRGGKLVIQVKRYRTTPRPAWSATCTAS